MLNRYALLLIAGLAAATPAPAFSVEAGPGVACLLEDNAAELLPKLTNPWGDPGEGHIEKDVVFSGSSAVKITILQRYCNFIPGWAYSITENPKEGEFRYLRFAWKSDGLAGIMLQLHDDKDWHIRYTAGANKFGWTSQTVADALPEEWTLVTIDLFKDFGNREIHGIALTTFDGAAGYFDHIYLGRTIADLDAIDATGLSAMPLLTLTPEEVETHWKQLDSTDGASRYRSFWTLAAGGDSVRPLLALKLEGESVDADAAKIAEWIKQLDDDDFAVREQATADLATHIAVARKLLEAELGRTSSAEARSRLETILKTAEQELSDSDRRKQQARRILRVIAGRMK